MRVNERGRMGVLAKPPFMMAPLQFLDDVDGSAVTKGFHQRQEVDDPDMLVGFDLFSYPEYQIVVMQRIGAVRAVLVNRRRHDHLRVQLLAA